MKKIALILILIIVGSGILLMSASARMELPQTGEIYVKKEHVSSLGNLGSLAFLMVIMALVYCASVLNHGSRVDSAHRNKLY